MRGDGLLKSTILCLGTLLFCFFAPNLGVLFPNGWEPMPVRLPMSRPIITICPVCGDTALSPVLSCKDGYATGERFDICRCESCGFLLTQQPPTAEEIGRYYETDSYISHSDTRKGLMQMLYHRVRTYMLGRKARLIERLTEGRRGRLLDVGAGTGYFAHAMASRGWKVTAVEPSLRARNFAKETFGMELLPAEDLEGLPPASFNVITLWHVMEHLHRLDETWLLLSGLLTPDGRLIVAVPNKASYDARHYGADWAAYDVPRHLWHFDFETMQRLAARHGFELTHCKPMPFDAFYVSMLSEQQRGNRPAFLRGLLVGTRALIASWGNKRRSSSLIFVFRKHLKGQSS